MNLYLNAKSWYLVVLCSLLGLFMPNYRASHTINEREEMETVMDARSGEVNYIESNPEPHYKEARSVKRWIIVLLSVIAVRFLYDVYMFRMRKKEREDQNMISNQKSQKLFLYGLLLLCFLLALLALLALLWRRRRIDH